MKTTIDIPEQTLREVLRFTKAKTKKEAIVKAVENFNKRQRLEKLAGILGTFRDFMSPEELKKMREQKL